MCLCTSLHASLHAAVVDLVFLVCNTLLWAWSLMLIIAPGRLGRKSTGAFCLACQDMSWLCSIRPAAELSNPRLVLSFPSPLIWREHCLFPSVWLVVFNLAILSLVGLLVPSQLCFCHVDVGELMPTPKNGNLIYV